MPIKGGKATAQERVFVQAMAATGDKGYAGDKAGFSRTSGAASKALARPAVQAEIVRLQTERLFSTILPLAIEQHESALRDPATPAGAKAQLIKLAYDRTLGVDDKAAEKEPHEMTAEEIDARIAKLRQAAADRAKPVLELEAVKPEPGVFE